MEAGTDSSEGWGESEPATDVEPLFSDDTITDSASEVNSLLESDRRSRSEEDHLLERVAFHKSQGRARSRRKPWSQSLVERELDFWRQFCEKIKREPVECLTACEAETIKAYLEWRVKNFRVKKESTMKSYWKRISCAYIDTAGRRMDNGTELDIRDWIPTYLTPTYGLETSEKEKRAMFVQEFYVFEYAHWVEDRRPLHGLIRVEIWALQLLSGATACRPGALVVSGSAKGTNKAVWFEHVEILKIRHPENPSCTVLAAKVNLVHIKDSGGQGRRKKFVFYEEPTYAFCLVYALVAVAFAHAAFRRPFKSVQELLSLTVPPSRHVLRLKFKREILKTPFFRDVEWTDTGYRLSDSKAFPYHKYRDHHVHLCRLVGKEELGELYDLRRGSGRNIHREFLPPFQGLLRSPIAHCRPFCIDALIAEEADQVMGHHGDTYRRFYLPDLIERDFSSIYFGTPPQDELVRAIARMSLTWDKRAPTDLSPQQKQEVRNHPELVRLRRRRDRYRQKLSRLGFHPLRRAAGHPDYIRYKAAERKINTMTTTLKNKRLDEEIRLFHDTIDDLEIDRQLDGRPVAEPYTPRVMEFESPERALIAKFISLSLDDSADGEALGGKAAFIDALVNLCHQQEGRRYPGEYDYLVNPMDVDSRSLTGLDLAAQPACRRVQVDSTKGEREAMRQHQDSMGLVDGEEAQVSREHVCLLCGKAFKRKFTLNRHLDIHVKAGRFTEPFQCRVAGCTTWLKGEAHYKNHCATAHDVFH
ncbi:uncharacterized protein Z519_12105 [Cladophialophora bantiana CBS 173.52]|uniref:C2H2-type domain-containing protein n=1 Tax=Cladophialophora bantiana (strain ATCC 10958 / CBS 173.52 / CDC B-1940 / NIH 8579) TaxID=1442370 RepID=A0A0D2H1P7_CLAB1|nr:uncharacterized protein Z519_12105 [Cladophialophora bantiana CBS 173.52]KIW87203.1 hypothetical protein Z519_12105 [Cladophialophora bantiana CBS 173.52]